MSLNQVIYSNPFLAYNSLHSLLDQFPENIEMDENSPNYPITLLLDFYGLVTFIRSFRFQLTQEIVPGVALNTRSLLSYFLSSIF